MLISHLAVLPLPRMALWRLVLLLLLLCGCATCALTGVRSRHLIHPIPAPSSWGWWFVPSTNIHILWTIWTTSRICST